MTGLSAVDAQVWHDRFEHSDARSLEQHIAQAQRMGVGTVIPDDKDWPTALDDLGDRRPYVLWSRGTPSLLTGPLNDFVTITGSRAATSYGEHVAASLASNLDNAERVVVAGGAYGIEGAAHRAALASGSDTIAVLANGIDRMILVGHPELLERVADLGLTISEVPPGATPTRHRLLARDRLMAAISEATVVVEAGTCSGSMTVARRAHDLGRVVGAAPRPVSSATSIGPHELLELRIACIVTHSEQIIRIRQAEGSESARERFAYGYARTATLRSDQRVL